MLFTQNLFPSLYPWLFLVITVIAAFVKPKLWPFGLVCTLIHGLLYNAIDLVGLGVFTLLLAMSNILRRTSAERTSMYYNAFTGIHASDT